MLRAVYRVEGDLVPRCTVEETHFNTNREQARDGLGQRFAGDKAVVIGGHEVQIGVAAV